MKRHPITQSDAATQAAALANNERFCRDIGVGQPKFSSMAEMVHTSKSLIEALGVEQSHRMSRREFNSLIHKTNAIWLSGKHVTMYDAAREAIA